MNKQRKKWASLSTAGIFAKKPTGYWMNELLLRGNENFSHENIMIYFVNWHGWWSLDGHSYFPWCNFSVVVFVMILTKVKLCFIVFNHSSMDVIRLHRFVQPTKYFQNSFQSVSKKLLHVAHSMRMWLIVCVWCEMESMCFLPVAINWRAKLHLNIFHIPLTLMWQTSEKVQF